MPTFWNTRFGRALVLPITGDEMSIAVVAELFFMFQFSDIPDRLGDESLV